MVAEPEMICQLAMSREHPPIHAVDSGCDMQGDINLNLRYDAFSKSLIKSYARNIFFVSLCLALCRRLFPGLQNPRPKLDLKSTIAHQFGAE